MPVIRHACTLDWWAPSTSELNGPTLPLMLSPHTHPTDRLPASGVSALAVLAALILVAPVASYLKPDDAVSNPPSGGPPVSSGATATYTFEQIIHDPKQGCWYADVFGGAQMGAFTTDTCAPLCWAELGEPTSPFMVQIAVNGSSDQCERVDSTRGFGLEFVRLLDPGLAAVPLGWVVVVANEGGHMWEPPGCDKAKVTAKPANLCATNRLLAPHVCHVISCPLHKVDPDVQMSETARLCPNRHLMQCPGHITLAVGKCCTDVGPDVDHAAAQRCV